MPDDISAFDLPARYIVIQTSVGRDCRVRFRFWTGSEMAPGVPCATTDGGRTGAVAMKVLLVHPSALLYSEVYLRLEPLGLECVANALLRAGHDVRLLDLQIFNHR